MKQFLLTLSIITLMVSCDCYQVIRGTIIDDKTGEPLSNITVYNKKNNWDKTETDTAGYFELSSISGGLRCPPMTVIVDDSNYKRIEISIDAGGEREIRLERVPQFNADTLKQAKAIKTLRDIFEDYKQNEEGIDSDDNKNAVTKSLQTLKGLTDPKDYELLINIWEYYDPTDYSCKQLVLNVLLQDRAKSIAAVKDRIKHKKSWETGETEFKYLLRDLNAK